MTHLALLVLWLLGVLAGVAVATRRWYLLCGALGWSLLAFCFALVVL